MSLLWLKSLYVVYSVVKPPISKDKHRRRHKPKHKHEHKIQYHSYPWTSIYIHIPTHPTTLSKASTTTHQQRSPSNHKDDSKLIILRSPSIHRWKRKKKEKKALPPPLFPFYCLNQPKKERVSNLVSGSRSPVSARPQGPKSLQIPCLELGGEFDNVLYCTVYSTSLCYAYQKSPSQLYGVRSTVYTALWINSCLRHHQRHHHHYHWRSPCTITSLWPLTMYLNTISTI